MSSVVIQGNLNRVVTLVDMDCFYVQVEERYNPHIIGVPAAVVQYKEFQGGGIIAVNYEARARGVKRNMRGDEAKSVCPEIVLVRVPENHGKADLTKYRDAGKEVVDVLCQFSNAVERASIDEAYLDLTEPINEFITKATPNPVSDPIACLDAIDASYLSDTYPIGFDSVTAWLEHLRKSELIQMEDVRLAIGAELAGRMRKAVLEQTGFKCSAGIAHNKVLAKLGAGMNKPNKQTLIYHDGVPMLYAKTKIDKVRNLGGQTGAALFHHMNCETMSDVLNLSFKKLCEAFGNEKGQWLFNLARGYDEEPVTQRSLPKTIGCSKNFRGPETLRTREDVKRWIGSLCEEIVERIHRDWELNNRRANLLTLHVTFLIPSKQNRKEAKSVSRSCGSNVHYDAEKMSRTVMAVMDKLYQEFGVLPIINLGLIAGKLVEETLKCGKISDFYRIVGVGAPETSASSVCNSREPPDKDLDIVAAKSEQINEINEKPPESPVKISAARIYQSQGLGSQSHVEIDVEACTPPGTNLEVPKDKSCTVSGVRHIIPETPKKIVDVENNLLTFVCTKSPSKEPKNNSVRKVEECKNNCIELETVAGPSRSREVSKPKMMHVQSIALPVETKSVGINVENVPEQDVEIVSNSEHDLASEYKRRCEKCGEFFPLWEYDNHQDFHVALELQDVFNGKSFMDSTKVPTSSTTGQKRVGTSNVGVQSSNKRPRHTKLPSKKEQQGKVSTLDGFLIRKT